jgi:hypothetical protein
MQHDAAYTSAWFHGHAIAQAVRCWFLIAGAWVESQESTFGISSWWRGTRAGFSQEYFSFLLPTIISQMFHSLFSMIWGWYNGLTCCPSTKGLCLTLPQKKKVCELFYNAVSS